MSNPMEHPPGRTPRFSSVDEEAAFWDTHDTGAFADEFEPVENVVVGAIRTRHGLLVRFEGNPWPRWMTSRETAGPMPRR